ncbi:MAG: 4-hydroxy-3-methylbut-2-enyl diphosphate reductase [Leptospiraceae bacterium]|nr:4-hydroxy-3-methylbut-2-enyl diphosphate reductase [Leptospiraceae bacterium]
MAGPGVKVAREFDIPLFYRSEIISTIKKARKESDRYRKDLSPSSLNLGDIEIRIARHFGFCFGVENAIEIAYRALEENPDRRIFLLSEMIHNPHVNEDLISRGIRFLMRTDGTSLIPFSELKPDDIVIVPAFGTTVEMFKDLESRGIQTQTYNTTCPFVEKVWNRSEQLGQKGYTIIIHGRAKHEETRATFSHARSSAPSLVIQDMEEARELGEFISGRRPMEGFLEHFNGRYSPGFDPDKDLQRIGVVNQTTMLATETHDISEYLKNTIASHFQTNEPGDRFADTRDTLCYATSENQQALYALLESGGDVAIIVGGYNSSNTSHLVELCERQLPTFYVKDEREIKSLDEIQHLNAHSGKVQTTSDWFPRQRIDANSGPIRVLVSAGASCPDALVDRVVSHLADLLGRKDRLEEALDPFRKLLASAEQ